MNRVILFLEYIVAFLCGLWYALIFSGYYDLSMYAIYVLCGMIIFLASVENYYEPVDKERR